MPNKNRDIVLFLGAGFSKGAELPTMKEFGAASDEQLASLKEPRKYRNATPLLIKAGETFTQFRSFCDRANRFSSIEINDMEKIFCIAETMIQAGIKKINIKSTQYKLSDVNQEIKYWLWKIYQQCPLVKHRKKHGSLPAIYENLISLFKDSNLWDRLTIISTNYDLIFEYLLFSHGIKPDYPSTFETLSAIDRSPYDSYLNKEHSGATASPLICKLHGSINYFESSIQGNSKLYVVDDIIRRNEKIGESQNRDIDKPAIFMVDAIWNLEKKYNLKLVPAIIPPTYSKLGNTQWLKETWKRALKALSLSKKILFIGYSLPDSDGFMHSLFHSAMAVRSNPHPIKYLIVNKDNAMKIDETFERYHKLLCTKKHKIHDDITQCDLYINNYTKEYFEDSWDQIKDFLQQN